MGNHVIALAGAGDLGRYLCDEICSHEGYSVVVLTRQNNRVFSNSKITAHTTDYTKESITSILNETKASALISLVRCPDEDYINLHEAMLDACLKSESCKRFIPSEWAGDIEQFPNIPGAYGKTRAPFRKTLQQTQGIQWTLLNHGWFMEYFLPENQSYMTYLPGEFPIDPPTWSYSVRGTGEEPQTWTCGRDVGKAVVALMSADEWENVTYIAGEWGTFNHAAKILDAFYGRSLKRTYRPAGEIYHDLNKYAAEDNFDKLAIAEAEEWTISGATSCPREKTNRQKQKYFPNVDFLTLEGMLLKASMEGHV